MSPSICITRQPQQRDTGPVAAGCDIFRARWRGALRPRLVRAELQLRAPFPDISPACRPIKASGLICKSKQPRWEANHRSPCTRLKKGPGHKLADLRGANSSGRFKDLLVINCVAV